MSYGSHLATSLIAISLASRTLAGDLECRVIEDHSGAPVISADVHVKRADTWKLVADLETDGQGRASVPGLPASTYRLEISKNNFLSTTAEIRIPKEGTASAVIRMARCAVVSGQATDPDGHPLAGAIVQAIPRNASGTLSPGGPSRTRFLTSVDEQGQYRLSGLTPGSYLLALSYGASPWAMGRSGRAESWPFLGSGLQFYPDNLKPEVFQIAGGEEYGRIDFRLSAVTLSNVNGQLELPAEARDGRFWVALTPVNQPALAAVVTETAADGAFHFTGVPSGAYHVLASGPVQGYGGTGGFLGTEPWFGRTQVQTGAQDLDGLSFPVQKGGRVSIVLNAESSCAPTAEVLLAPLEDWSMHLDRRVTAHAGTPVVLDDLAPTRYQVFVHASGSACYGAELSTLDLNAGTAATLQVRVAEGGRIDGRVAGAKRARGLVVVLTGLQGETEWVTNVTPTEDGCFQFQGLAPGKYSVVVRPLNSALDWDDAAQNMQEVQVQGGRAIAVTLEAPAEEPASGDRRN